jgi:hypothetical protein
MPKKLDLSRVKLSETVISNRRARSQTSIWNREYDERIRHLARMRRNGEISDTDFRREAQDAREFRDWRLRNRR